MRKQSGLIECVPVLPLYLPLGAAVAVVVIMFAFGCRSAPVEPIAIYTSPKCVEGAQIDSAFCADKLTPCKVFCVDGKASKCGPCGGDPEDPDAGPEQGDTGGTTVSANNTCRANLAENKPKPIALNQAQQYAYNANRTYLNDTRPRCATGAGPDGPDGVTMFAISGTGTLIIKVKSAERGSGKLSLYTRTACQDVDLPATKQICAGADCLDGTQAACATVCLPEHEVACKDSVKDGEMISQFVYAGDRILVGWNQSDPTAGAVVLDVSLVP
jgi:hypothetical protein